MTEKRSRNKTARTLCYIAVATAILSVCAWIAVPIGEIPVTLQTFALCLLAGLLGVKNAIAFTAAYLLLGFIGVPVFSGFTGGIAKLFSPTGGFLIGFLVSAPLIAWICKGAERRKGIFAYLQTSAGMTAGILLCFATQTVWTAILSAQAGAAVGLWAIITVYVLPYLPFELLKIITASVLTVRLKRKNMGTGI